MSNECDLCDDGWFEGVDGVDWDCPLCRGHRYEQEGLTPDSIQRHIGRLYAEKKAIEQAKHTVTYVVTEGGEPKNVLFKAVDAWVPPIGSVVAFTDECTYKVLGIAHTPKQASTGVILEVIDE